MQGRHFLLLAFSETPDGNLLLQKNEWGSIIIS